jgi:hypothetical protein
MLNHGWGLVEPFHLKNIVDLKVPLNRLIPGTLKEVQLVDVAQDPPDQHLSWPLPVNGIKKRKKKKEKKTRGHKQPL